MIEKTNKSQSDEELPSISIITPSYQQGIFIEETIRSIVNQNYTNLEHIIIDGGSSDQSVEIIRKYEDSLSYWVSERDDGQTDAINKGFRIANSEIITWINSDDILTPGALNAIGSFFRDNPTIQVVYGDGIAIDKEGKKLFVRRSKVFDLEWFIRTDFVIQPSGFFRHSFLKQMNYLDENLHYAMDTDIFLRMALHSTPQYIPLVLSGYRIHQEAKTSEGRFPFSIDIIYIIDKILKADNYSKKITFALINSLFWRVMEIFLILERTNGIFPNNHPIPINCVKNYLKLLRPVYEDLINSKRGTYNEALCKGYLRILQLTGKSSRINEELQDEWIKNQGVDSLIFVYRQLQQGRRKNILNNFIISLINNPKMAADKNLYKVIKSMVHSGLN